MFVVCRCGVRDGPWAEDCGHGHCTLTAAWPMQNVACKEPSQSVESCIAVLTLCLAREDIANTSQNPSPFTGLWQLRWSNDWPVQDIQPHLSNSTMQVFFCFGSIVQNVNDSACFWEATVTAPCIADWWLGCIQAQVPCNSMGSKSTKCSHYSVKGLKYLRHVYFLIFSVCGHTAEPRPPRCHGFQR